MQMQSGACAFSNACTHGGPRFRLEGTNRRFCGVHIRAMHEAQPAAAGDGDFGHAAFTPPRSARRSAGWPTYAGITGSGW